MRTFLAVPLPSSVRKKLNQLALRLQREGVRLRWTEPDQFHVTLCFLGDIEDVRVADACRAVEEVAQRFEPIEAHLTGVGAFPNLSKVRVVWSGFKTGEEELVSLQRASREAFEDRAFPMDRGRFHPHITLGRIPGRRVEMGLEPLLAPFAEHEIGRFDIDELVLFHSHLTREGPVYTPLGRFPMG